jgi:large subunit ribosomal protein L16
VLRPAKTKFAKYHKLSIKGIEKKAHSSYSLKFGLYGLQAIETGLITPQQIESMRRTVVKNLVGTGCVWIRVFPDKVVTSKPKEVRMGRGKGNLKTFVFKTKVGRLLIEATSRDPEICKKALLIAATKLPVHCQLVKKGL